MTDAAVTDSLTVQNVVASTTIDRDLALQPLAEDLDGADYTTNPAPTLTHTSDNCAQSPSGGVARGRLYLWINSSYQRRKDTISTFIPHVQNT
jgi:hypothetical protein